MPVANNPASPSPAPAGSGADRTPSAPAIPGGVVPGDVMPNAAAPDAALLDAAAPRLPLSNVALPPDFDRRRPGVTYGQLREFRYFSKSTGNKRRSWVLTPPDFDPAISYPCLYLLHGIGGTQDEWLQGRPVEIVGNLIPDGACAPFITVIPNVRTAANDRVPTDMFSETNIAAFDAFIKELTGSLRPAVNEKYHILTDREHQAIGGLSMGGRESLFIASQLPDDFCAVGAFSPAPGLLAMKADFEHPGQMSEKDLKFRKDTRLYICNGADEPMFDTVAKQYCDTIRENGNTLVYERTSGGHDFQTWKYGLYRFVTGLFN